MANISEVQDYLIVQPTTPTNPTWKLAQKINSTQTTITVNFEPKENGATITKSFLLGIETNGYVETMLCTNVSGTTLTVVRGIALAGLDFAGDAATYGATHAAGQKVFTNISAPLLNMVLQALRGQIGSTIQHAALQSFIGAATQNERTFADATARDAALTSPVDGDKCLTLDTGLQYYNSGWQTLGTATPVTASLGCEKVGNDIRLDLAASNDLLTLSGNELDKNVTPSATEINQLSGTTNIAEADTFFGATDITGAEAEELTDGSNTSLHTHNNVANVDFDAITIPANQSATLTINHNLGVIPKIISFSASSQSTVEFSVFGCWTNSKQKGVHRGGSNEYIVDASNALPLKTANTSGTTGNVQNVTDTSFQIAFTVVGSPGSLDWGVVWQANS